MKKIGILHGKETSFPEAFVARVNAKNVKGVQAEPTHVDELMQGNPSPYAVMIDRISQDVPFFRAYLKNAALNGTAVLNNPFWWSADEKFFNNCLSTKVGLPVPKTILLPSKEMPPDTSGESFRNMKYPLDWEKMIDYLGGFPLYMKPHSGGGWKSVYKVHNFDEFFTAYNETNTLVMLLQECIDFDSYFRCYCLGGKYVRIMDYEPRNPHHLRYVADFKHVTKAQRDEMHQLVLMINGALGYDFNTLEFAIRDGVPYAIDFCNPAPDADVNSVGEANFEWVVENAANMAIERALAHKEGGNNLTWGTFVQDSVAGRMPSGPAPSAAPAAKSSGKASKAKK
jgi:glutathione synthase/RimK-type ligase-like ATP-grasp enzyme